MGIAVALLTGLWLHDELSFNKYHKNYDRIAEVAMTGVTAYGPFTSPSLSYPMANLLRTDYKDQFLRLVRATDGAGAILSGDDKNFRVSGQYMDEGAPELFSLNMIREAAPDWPICIRSSSQHQRPKRSSEVPIQWAKPSRWIIS